MKKIIISILFSLILTFISFPQTCSVNNISPVNHSIINTLTPNLVWNLAYQINCNCGNGGYPLEHVTLYIATDSLMSNLIYTHYVPGMFPTHEVIPSNILQYNQTYWWNVGFYYTWNCTNNGFICNVLNCTAPNSTPWSFTTSITGLHQIESDVPDRFSLSQNFPNPFNPSTKVKFEIPKEVFTILKVYDVVGLEVATLVYEQLNPGVYETDFDGTNLSSGVYFYVLKAEEFLESKKMFLLK